ncbi:fimbria/pilus outer membrane usher protein [uncultured Ralstonia sp.]|uniref:fimbria/pilus outer membrane usher protein n=1 Tax=Ralstonia sp. TaxID=54061 RepID=UPI0025F82A9D|nr:fimbria/pilus outer membrane usher protein [uncultured Ralstonia sp.]
MSAIAAMSPPVAWAAQQQLAGAQSTDSASEKQDRKAAFDADALRARGIDPALAAYFSQAPRFTPGRQRVKLIVNDESRGSASARFDEQGQLCVDRALLERAGLKVPEALQGEGAPGCYDYRADHPQAEIELDPGDSTVRLVVPQEALRPTAEQGSESATGGTAAILNYSLLGMTNQGGGSNSRFLFADGEIGMNAGDWIVRSRHSYTSQDGASNINHLYTYAQKTFAEHKAMVQVGQINVAGSLLPVPPIIGAQYAPDPALVPQAGGPSFEGVANGQSRVEVRQLGVLIYSTVVPAGPFTLSGLPLLSSSADLDITLVENDGNQRRYTLPAASLRQTTPAPLGLQVAIGKVRDVSDAGIDTPLLVTATKGWRVGDRHSVMGGALATSGYQAVAAGASAAVSSNISANLQSIVSNAQRESVRGINLSGSLNVRLAESWSASVTATQQTEGYRAVGDTLVPTQGGVFTRVKNQYTASMGWQHPLIGGVTAAYSRGSAYNGTGTQYAMVSWNRKIGSATLSVNLEKDLGNTTTSLGARAARSGGVRFYAMLSMPLGKASAQSYVTNAGGDTRFGAGVSQTVNEALSYAARAETNPSGNGPNVNGALSLTPRYTQAMLTYAQNGNSSSYSGQLQGGAVLTPSPYQIGDTFGVVQTGDLSGVRISTPQGTVWTDPTGRAVIPTLSPYRPSRVELLTKSLPRNVDINNGIEYVNAGRGSVNIVEFGVSKVRRLLLRVTSDKGAPLPAALPVVDAEGRYVTTSVGDGTVFLDDVPKSDLHVKLDDGQTCQIRYTLPEKPDLDRPFDVATGVCQG